MNVKFPHSQSSHLSKVCRRRLIKVAVSHADEVVALLVVALVLRVQQEAITLFHEQPVLGSRGHDRSVATDVALYYSCCMKRRREEKRDEQERGDR